MVLVARGADVSLRGVNVTGSKSSGVAVFGGALNAVGSTFSEHAAHGVVVSHAVAEFTRTPSNSDAESMARLRLGVGAAENVTFQNAEVGVAVLRDCEARFNRETGVAAHSGARVELIRGSLDNNGGFGVSGRDASAGSSLLGGVQLTIDWMPSRRSAARSLASFRSPR